MVLPTIQLEVTMLRTTRPNTKAGLARTVVASAVGLLPAGLVSGLMLLQIFGLWTR
jgi:hypothetical protein